MALVEGVSANDYSIPLIKITLGKKNTNSTRKLMVKPNTNGKSTSELKQIVRNDHEIKGGAMAKLFKASWRKS